MISCADPGSFPGCIPPLMAGAMSCPESRTASHPRGKGSDGRCRILDIVPTKLHQRLPLFLGSRLDIEELEGYADVQQLSGKKYDV